MSLKNAKRKRFIKWRIDQAIHQAITIAGDRSFEQAFQRLLTVVVSRSDLLRRHAVSGYAGWAHAERYLRGLLAVAEHRKNWLRDVVDWQSIEGSLLQQFGSLTRHLLATHPVPGFMTLVWFAVPSETARRHQKLFSHLGRGNNIRGASLPILLTKHMARFFMQAPDHLTVEQALRWSQVRGLGGDDRLASAVLSTRLGTTFQHETYWEKVLKSLIAQHKLDIELVPPIIDYMHVRRDRFLPQPRRKMNERSFGSFLARVRKWMKQNPNYGRRPKLCWSRTSIGGFRYIEPQRHNWSVRYWTIRELTDSRELIDEGKAMRHCVAAYAEDCDRRTTSIWSMKNHGLLDNNRVLTIRVVPDDRTIVTALGRCNSRPSPYARQIMEMWAHQERLTIAKWV